MEVKVMYELSKREKELTTISSFNSRYIKGVAILMMIFHHFFGFPERILCKSEYVELIVAGHNIDNLIAIACKLCVCMFAWLTGYGMFYTYSKIRNSEAVKSCLTRIGSLIGIYWIVLICTYCPLAFFFKEIYQLVE